MQYKDYYKTLGVARDAAQDDIKRAYRKLARKYHPDVSKEADAERRFKEINEANEVLRDPEKRAAYDALGDNWRAGQDFRPPPGTGGAGPRYQDFHFGEGANPDFSDFFSSIFGRAFHAEDGHGARRQRGSDTTTRITITLPEAYSGVTRQLRLAPREAGGQANADTRTLSVKIPAGVTSGRQIRLAGQGLPGLNGGAAGDLYLEVEIEPHAHFTLEERDVHLTLPITPWEAALGATVTAPTLGGSVNLKIPPGTQSGSKMRLKGRGLPGKPDGDEIVLLEIKTPPADTSEARELYRTMAERLGFNPRAHLEG